MSTVSITPAVEPRVIKRSKLNGTAGFRHGLGWVVVPKASRDTLKCTECDGPATEAWLAQAVTASQSGKPTQWDTVVKCYCGRHSPLKAAQKMHPKETRNAESRAEIRREREAAAVADKQVRRFLAFLTNPGLAKHPIIAEVFDQYQRWHGLKGKVAFGARLDKVLNDWLESLPEAERTLAVLGRE
jgi:hypothetical protein